MTWYNRLGVAMLAAPFIGVLCIMAYMEPWTFFAMFGVLAFILGGIFLAQL